MYVRASKLVGSQDLGLREEALRCEPRRLWMRQARAGSHSASHYRSAAGKAVLRKDPQEGALGQPVGLGLS